MGAEFRRPEFEREREVNDPMWVREWYPELKIQPPCLVSTLVGVVPLERGIPSLLLELAGT